MTRDELIDTVANIIYDDRFDNESVRQTSAVVAAGLVRLVLDNPETSLYLTGREQGYDAGYSDAKHLLH